MQRTTPLNPHFEGGANFKLAFTPTYATTKSGTDDKAVPPRYRCPICGAQLDGGDTLAVDVDGFTVGCIYCIRYQETWETII